MENSPTAVTLRLSQRLAHFCCGVMGEGDHIVHLDYHDAIDEDIDMGPQSWFVLPHNMNFI